MPFYCDHQLSQGLWFWLRLNVPRILLSKFCLVTAEHPPAPPVFQCSFENNLCDMFQDKTDSPNRDPSGTGYIDWIRHTDETETHSTGPSSGQGGSGWYIYAESSAPKLSKDETRYACCLHCRFWVTADRNVATSAIYSSRFFVRKVKKED